MQDDNILLNSELDNDVFTFSKSKENYINKEQSNDSNSNSAYNNSKSNQSNNLNRESTQSKLNNLKNNNSDSERNMFVKIETDVSNNLLDDCLNSNIVSESDKTLKYNKINQYRSAQKQTFDDMPINTLNNHNCKEQSNNKYSNHIDFFSEG